MRKILILWALISLTFTNGRVYADGAWGECKVSAVSPGAVIDSVHIISCKDATGAFHRFELNRKDNAGTVHYETCLKFATLSLMDQSVWLVTTALTSPENGPMEINNEKKNNQTTMCGIKRR
ncbi:MAG: hypothetical protein NT027_07760 [Proteobacteria bacterium]|nr:hypothetical protein [Pseudomonadota bacterium]